MQSSFEPLHVTSGSGGGASPLIFRFEFSKQFMDVLYQFSKIHQYDDRHSYKEAWKEWTMIDEISGMIEEETRRMVELGYLGNVEDKMFKSGRYYFRKKSGRKVVVTCDIEDADDEASSVPGDNGGGGGGDNSRLVHLSASSPPRRQYITMNKNTLLIMDEHIRNTYNSSSIGGAVGGACGGMLFTPARSFEDFCITHSDVVEREVCDLISKNPRSMHLDNRVIAVELMLKIKKTYKNRYFMMREDLFAGGSALSL